MSEVQKNEPDIRERGKDKNGQPISLDKRLFMQLVCFGNCTDTNSVIDTLQESGIEGVVCSLRY